MWGHAPERAGRESGDHNGKDAGSKMTRQQLKEQLDTLVLIPDERLLYEVFRGVCTVSTLDALEVAQIRITM
jgi:hypothetical protein